MPNLEKLKRMSNVKTFKENEYLFREGDPGEDMFIVLSGKVAIYIKSEDNLQIKVSEMVAGDFLGEMSLLEGEPRSATAVAADYTITLAVNRGNFEAFVLEQPGMAFKLLKGLSSRIRSLNQTLSRLKKAEQCTLESHQPASAPAKAVRPQTPDNLEVLKKLLYHEGHKKYDREAPETDFFYTYEKKVSCPICGKEFELLSISQSKLRLKAVDADFRHNYEEFEPLWYEIWVCPGCYFAGHAYEYDKPQEHLHKVFAEKTKTVKDKLNFKFSQPRTLDEVFTAYYLALHSAKACNADPLKSAKLWLQLSWLYKDLDDEEMYNSAAALAFDRYYDALYGSSQSKMSVEQDQQCCLILGELYLRKNNKQEAIRHYHSAIRRSGGSSAYNKQAQDRIYYVKHEMK
ncbi:MAG TPA: DUF2225 domain-containing protein [Clostridia bacterium]|nr:DUF2225 domain-containing protein [Clostridia bacterium]